MPGWRTLASVLARSSRASQRQNVVTPAGSIDTHGPQVFIRVDGAYDDLQKIADTPIVAAGRDAEAVRYRPGRRGYEDPATFLIRHDGEPAMVLGVVMKEGWNALDLGKALDAEERKIRRSCRPAFRSRRSAIRR